MPEQNLFGHFFIFHKTKLQLYTFLNGVFIKFWLLSLNIQLT